MKAATQRTQEGHHLTFRLAGEQYAISIRKVREIIEYNSVRPVPGTPSYVRGVINLRGAVVPVVDLALKFGLDSTIISKETCIIILDVLVDGEPGSMGVMTEAVSEVLELRDDDIEQPPAFGTQVHVDYLLGMAMLSGRMALVLNIDEILQTDEIVPAIEKAPENDDEETHAPDEADPSEREPELESSVVDEGAGEGVLEEGEGAVAGDEAGSARVEAEEPHAEEDERGPHGGDNQPAPDSEC